MRARDIVHYLLLSFVTAAAPGCTFAPGRSSVPRDGTDVPLSLEDNQPVVEVSLNGQGPIRVLVDTGATPAVAVTPALAKKLGLRRHLGYVRLHAANGKWVRGDRTKLRSVRLGDAEFHDVPAIILDIGEADFPAVIGMALFSRCVVTLHFPTQRLSLRPGTLSLEDPDAFPTPFVYGVPLVPVSPPRHSGQRGPVNILLDTGSNGGMVLPASLRDDLETDPDFSGHAVADTLGGTRTIDLVKLRGKLTLGSFGANDPVVGLAPGRGSIGTLVLRGFDVSVDQRSRRVRLKLPPNPPVAIPPIPAAAAAR